MMRDQLIDADKRFVVERLPRDVRDLLSANSNRLFVGGGWIRACVAGETPNDVDIFGDTVELVESAAATLAAQRGDCKVHRTKNAITVLSPNRLPIQFITRWTFDKPGDLVKSFDFTVCQAAIWREGSQSNSAWGSTIGDRFYVDLAARRIVYTSPVREEEAGGSMLRAIKYIKRGYTIQVNSLGGIIARLTDSVRDSGVDRATVITALLREVDPLHVIDGMDLIDDHPDENDA